MIDTNIASLVDQQQRDVGLSSSPPTSPDGDVAAFCPRPVARRASSAAHPNDSPALLEPSLVPPFPLPVTSSLDVPTPLHETHPDFSFNFASTVLPATNVWLPTPPIVKTSHNLRLPSFDLLGIGAPHPDRILLPSHHSFSVGAGPLSKPEDPLHVLSPRICPFDGASDLPTTDPKLAKPRVDHTVPIFTPPTEEGIFNWGSVVNVPPAALGSPPNSDPGQSPGLATVASAQPLGSAPIIVPTPIEASGVIGMAAWTQSVKETLITEPTLQAVGSVKILSHALPCPSTKGHLFAQLIVAIHDRSPANTAWINVFHAVPGRFTLSDLPKSPPSTPGPAVGGDEYFTSKVFDSAVAIPDYQLDSKLLPPSPRPVVPPGSIHISIVERYIPPTNTNEYAEMFELKGRSLLRDRLVEVSPENGLLLFVYPTRAGGRTFMQQYLGPILDPLLRSLTVVHDLSSELGKNLGQMSSVSYLDDYEKLKDQVVHYCHLMSGNGSRDGQAVYTVIQASKEEAPLERSAWAKDWWIKQEKPRIRDTVNKYFRQVKKLPESGMTASNLIQEVLDGVANRKAEDNRRPPRGVEVGVFIIRKTMASTG